jgi:AcrR family transcriptional regulator
MPAGSTTRMPARERREQLLDATKAVVDADGFHAVSIESVARTAGITRPIVYHHFPEGLDELLVSLVERETTRALEQLAGHLSEERDLAATFAAYLDVVAADPVTWRIVLMAPEGTPAVLRDRIREGRAAFAAALAGVADFASPDPQLTGQLLQALADEAARLALDGFPRERLVAHARWLIGALRSAA